MHSPPEEKKHRYWPQESDRIEKLLRIKNQSKTKQTGTEPKLVFQTVTICLYHTSRTGTEISATKPDENQYILKNIN